MTHLLIVILNDLRLLPELLSAWQAIGLPGPTILEGAGGYRTGSWLTKVGLGALGRIFETEELQRRTLLSAVEGDELLAQAVAEAERVVGGFDQPDTGLLLVLPVVEAKGLVKAPAAPPQELSPPAIRPGWMVRRDTPVQEVDAILNLKPIIVRPDTPLDKVAQAMLASPNVHVACVVNEAGRLVGLLGLRTLADDLFFHIMPEEFLGEATDLEQVMEFAKKSGVRTAKDAMREPVWVKVGERVKDAFKRMHDHRISGLPVVDNTYQVVGYINLLELMAACVEEAEGEDHGEAAR
ncbi:MAG: CBS domain-containing protein [Anaerolineales bacterium]